VKKNGATHPIGVFDSGIGGLTVFKAMRKELPREDIVYFGDTAHVPYGTKSKETITKFSIENTLFLQSFGVKMVVVACNTASSLALDALKAKFDIPIIGVIEPGAREAIRLTKSGRIGVIGTKSTIGSNAYETQLKKLEPSVSVFSSACPLFVPLVEEGWFEGEVVSKIAHQYLDQLKAFKIDTLILGCTHYPLLNRIIQRTMGSRVKLVNSAQETAKEAKRLLAAAQPRIARTAKSPSLQFYVSDEPEQFRTLGERFLGSPIPTVAKVGEHYRQPEFDRRAVTGVEGAVEGPFITKEEG
jgi:glutamate racemase